MCRWFRRLWRSGSLPFAGVEQGGGQKRQHELVVAGEVEAFAALQSRTLHHVGRGAVLANKIKIRGGEVFHLIPQVADHGERLQKDLGQEHGRTDVQVGPALEAAHQAAEEAEVVVAGLADGRAAGRGVDVDDVRADRHVHGHGDVQAGGRGEQAEIVVGAFRREQGLAHALTQPFALPGRAR